MGFREADWLSCVGDGWWHLVRPLLDRCRKENVDVHQVKEKFGGLRFYAGYCSEELQQMIEDAEKASYVTCETCGSPGRLRGGGWIKTLCDEHANERPVVSLARESS